MRYKKQIFSANLLLISLLVVIFVGLRLLMINQCIHLIHDNDPAEYRQLAVAEILHSSLSQKNFIFSLGCIPKTFDGGSFFPAYIIVAYIYYFISLITGLNYYSVKIATLLFSTIAFLFWLLLVKDNKKSIILMAIYLTAPPLFFLKWSLTLWAGSTECLFLYPLCLYLHINFKNSKKYIYTTGIAYGFAAYFSYLCVPLTAILSLSLIYKLYKIKKTDIYHFALAGFLGFSPWVLYQIFIADDTSLKLLSPYNQLIFFKNLAANTLAGPYLTPAFSLKHLPLEKTSIIFLIINLLAFPITYFKSKNVSIKNLILLMMQITILYLVMLSVSSYNTIPSDLRYYLPLYPIYAFILVIAASSKQSGKLITYTFGIIFILFSVINIRDNILFYKTGYADAYKYYKPLKYIDKKIDVPVNQAKNLNIYIDNLLENYSSAHTTGIYAALNTSLAARYIWATNEHGQNITSRKETVKYIKNKEKDFTNIKDIEEYYNGVGFGFFLKNYNDKFDDIDVKYHAAIKTGYINAQETFNKKS